MKQVFRVPLAALALTASLSAPLLADGVSDCQGQVISDCADAMADSNWAERIALGIVCAGRLVACGGVSISITAF